MIVPPFTLESAKHKVKDAQDAWNSCDPEKIIEKYPYLKKSIDATKQTIYEKEFPKVPLIKI